MSNGAFVDVSSYCGAPVFDGMIGIYEGFSTALSWGGHKRALLKLRLRGLRVMVIRPRLATKRPK